MIGKILGYAPSTLVPALVSFLMLYAYTRLLTPSAFGEFTFLFSGVLLVTNSVFFALPVAVTRFYLEAKAERREKQLVAHCYALLLALNGCVALCAFVSLFFLSRPEQILVLLSVGLIAVRSVVALAQSIRRVAERAWRYNLVECTQAVLGFALGLALIGLVGPSAGALIFALLAAGFACLVPNFRELLLPFTYRGKLGGPMLKRLAAFAWPVIAMDSIIMLLQLSDRFLLGALDGAGTLGIYAVAYSLVDRPTTLVCNAISTATFPMAVRALRDGPDASARQSGRNGAILLALVIPAAVGMALTGSNLAATLIGPEFRSGVVLLIPVMCATALMRGMSTHFIDHAFYLAERPARSLWVYGLAAGTNITLNLLLIPRYGALGAAYAGFLGQAGAVVFGWISASKIFPIWLPARDILSTIAAVAPMALMLSLITFPPSWAGLLQAVTSGAAIFICCALLLNICDSRKWASRFPPRFALRRP